MWSKARFCVVLVVLAAIGSGAAVYGQQTLDYPRGEISDYFLDSGKHANNSDELQLVYSDSVAVDSAVWLRLYFGQVSLPEGSFVRVTSVFDEDYQELDGDMMIEWSDSTAYFNGDTLLVDMFAAPHTVGNQIVLERVGFELGDMEGLDYQHCGICNGDDRSPSNEDFSARLMPVGCSGSIYHRDSCRLSAGHCARSGLTAQFRVPPSSSGGSPRHPPASEQFPVRQYRYTNGGVGNDWMVMTTGTNHLGETAYERYGELRDIAEALPASGSSDIWGYGQSWIYPTRSQTQQHSPGSIMSRLGSYYTMMNDATFGQSGSGYLQSDELIGIITHCNESGCGNIATRIDNHGLQNAIESLCPVSTLTCNYIKKHKSKCKRGGIKGKVKLWTDDFDGFTVTITINHTEKVQTEIEGRKAKYNNYFWPPGRYPVEITKPNCPEHTKTVKCE